MFYLKYLTALVVYIVVALKAAPLMRSLQQLTSYGLDWLEILFEIPAEYMVIGELIDMEGKLTFLLFCFVLFGLMYLLKTAFTAVFRKILPRRKAAK